MANITKEFLETAVGEEIEKYEINSGSNLGDNYSSLLYTIDITLKKKNSKILHLLLKCYPTNAGRQEFLSTGNIFQRELFVYSTLIPELIRFQHTYKNPGVDIIKPPFANFVHGKAVDYKNSPAESKVCQDPLDNFIIMPDLRKTGGYRLANRLVGFDLPHCQLVMEAQAKLHALSWSYKQTSGLPNLDEKFPFIKGTPMDDMDLTMFDFMFDNSRDLFRASVQSCVEDEEEKKILLSGLDRIRKLTNDIMSLYFGASNDLQDPSITKDNLIRVPGVVRDDEQSWNIVRHGDCWLNNMMFKYDEAGKPLEIVLVDLQMVSEGDPLSDICYSMFTSTTSSFRKAHMDDLLKLYVDTFVKICQGFNVIPPPGFDLPELQRRFHRAKIFGLVCCLMGFPIFLNDPKDAIDLETAVSGETGKDVFNEFVNMTKNIRANPRFDARVLDILREMNDQGIL